MQPGRDKRIEGGRDRGSEGHGSVVATIHTQWVGQTGDLSKNREQYNRTADPGFHTPAQQLKLL